MTLSKTFLVLGVTFSSQVHAFLYLLWNLDIHFDLTVSTMLIKGSPFNLPTMHWKILWCCWCNNHILLLAKRHVHSIGTLEPLSANHRASALSLVSNYPCEVRTHSCGLTLLYSRSQLWTLVLEILFWSSCIGAYNNVYDRHWKKFL